MPTRHGAACRVGFDVVLGINQVPVVSNESDGPRLEQAFDACVYLPRNEVDLAILTVKDSGLVLWAEKLKPNRKQQEA